MIRPNKLSQKGKAPMPKTTVTVAASGGGSLLRNSDLLHNIGVNPISHKRQEAVYTYKPTLIEINAANPAIIKTRQARTTGIIVINGRSRCVRDVESMTIELYPPTAMLISVISLNPLDTTYLPNPSSIRF